MWTFLFLWTWLTVGKGYFLNPFCANVPIYFDDFQYSEATSILPEIIREWDFLFSGGIEVAEEYRISLE